MADSVHIMPKLEPQDATYGIYQEYIPEKIELLRVCCGYIEEAKSPYCSYV